MAINSFFEGFGCEGFLEQRTFKIPSILSVIDEDSKVC
jgi:hypothetical protein